MSKISDVAIFRNLKVAAGALIYVTDSETGALEPLFSDPSLSVSKANPTVTDSDGAWEAYLLPGVYDIRAVKDDYEYITLNVGVDQSSGGAVSGGAFTLGDSADTTTGQIDYDENVVSDFLLFDSYSASGSGTDNDFVLISTERNDAYGVFAVGEFTNPADAAINFRITGACEIDNDFSNASGSVVLQRDTGSGYVDIQTLAALTSSGGSTPVNYDATITAIAGHKYRLYCYINDVEDTANILTYTNITWETYVRG